MHFFISVTVLVAVCAESKDFTPPRLTISLDAPPEHRWDEAVTRFNNSIHASLNSLMANPTYQEGIKVAEAVIKRDPSAVRDWYPEEQYQELKGIARVTKVDLWLLAAVTTIYDLTASGKADSKACTGLIVQKSNGEIIHGRNLDYSLKSIMSPLTAIIDFQRNNKTVWTSVSYVFMTGFNTVVRPGVLSLTQDERDQGSVLINWEDLFMQRRVCTFAQIRDVVDKSGTFDDALNQLKTVKLAADSYFILAGVNAGEGAIITRSRDPAAGVDVWRLGADTESKWYLLETNYDHWNKTSPTDNRRAAARRFIDAAGQASFSNNGY
jgi:hypothetical protein